MRISEITNVKYLAHRGAQNQTGSVSLLVRTSSQQQGGGSQMEASLQPPELYPASQLLFTLSLFNYPLLLSNFS